MSAICARLGSKGKVGVQRGRKTAGCPSFLPPPRVRRRLRRGARHAPAAAAANPPLRFSEKLSAPSGRTRLRSSRPPLSRCRKGAAPLGRTRLRSSRTPVRRCRKRSCTVRPNPLTQFEHPSQPVQESAGFHRDKNFQENMRYPLAKYAKIGYYIQALFCMNSRMMLNDVKNTIIWRHSDYDRR